MISDPSLPRAAITIIFGAMAGGITNAVAIWMLFHPYEPHGPKFFKLHGAIPKNKPRLAKTIGRTVGQRLLASDDLARQLGAPGVKEAFDGAVRGFVSAVLESERGALREELPADVFGEIDAIIEHVGDLVAQRVVESAGTESFRKTAIAFLARARDQVSDQPVSAILTAARREAIRDRVEQWVSDAVASPELDQIIGEWMDRQIVRLAADKTPLLERLPPGLVAAVEKEIADYLPVVIDRLASILGDPDARHQIQSALHQLFERFVRDLLIHQRIVARLVVTENTVTRLLDSFEREGADQLGQLLDQPEMRAQVARSVNDAIVNFLRRPMSDHIERLGAERIEGLKQTAADHVTSILRDPATASYGIEKLDQALQATERRTWGDLLQHIPPEQAVDWLAQGLQDPKAQRWISEGTTTAIRSLTDRRIGRPADLLPEKTSERVADQLSPALWDWIQQQLPSVMEKIDIEHMVEEKVLGFSLEKMEEIVRRTTQRELDVIVRLGYVLGAIVGAAAYGISLLI